jgi:hypothetical protein
MWTDKDAVHCVIEKVPRSWLDSDVIRLIPWDRTREVEHPVESGTLSPRSIVNKATRIYKAGLLSTNSYLLKFTQPLALQNFLNQLPSLKICGFPLIAKLFQKEMNKSHLRTGTIVNLGQTPSDVLRFRDEYFRDPTGQQTLVIVEGIPRLETLGSVTYWIRKELEGEYDWAYEWKNAPGEGTEKEGNAVPVGPRYGVLWGLS